ncbi:MAG: AIM24 family protein [Clostridiales bacterium]|jgi:uncharacterized protein (AIM24 family)|nr:AIM24 family protein [Clostridiales bacterium]
MFQIKTVNELYCSAVSEDGGGVIFTKAGAMVGYQGQCRFEKVMLGPQGNPLTAALGQVGRRLTGENLPLMKVIPNGRCAVLLANLAQHVTIINVTPGMTLAVESENILAFTDNANYGFKFLAQGVISQKGFFTSTLSSRNGTAQAAVLTEGNPFAIDTPCNVDPDALVAWTGPDPVPKLDLSWKNLIGQASGESYNFEFRTPGHKVIIQPSERTSGLHLGVDDNRYTPQNQQNQSLQGAMGNIGGLLGGQGGHGGQGGLGGVIGNLFNN